jgi:MerR family transcriptional regulator, repressor of the yfmOP operon
MDKFIMTSSDQTSSSASPSPCSYSIEQVAARTGMTKRTLRYYEEVGLLPPTERTEGNYRRYSDLDIQLLGHIKELRDLLGFSLADIRVFLMADEERSTIKAAFRQENDAATRIAQLERADTLIRQQLALIEQKISALQTMQTSLSARLERHAQMRQHLSDTLQS